MEEAAAHDEVLGRLLDVQDAGARRHPLGVTVGDDAAAAVGVVVLEDAVDHVGDGLEAAMGVPGRALGLAGRVLDLAHLVEVDEGVEVAQVHPGEGSADGEALAFEAAGRARHARDGAAPSLRIGPGETRQRGDVIDGDGWHGIPPWHRSRRWRAQRG